MVQTISDGATHHIALLDDDDVESVWIPNGLTASSVFLIQVIELLLTALFFYVFFLMVSVVMLSCVYFYGSTSESIDDITLENDIENFENL